MLTRRSFTLGTLAVASGGVPRSPLAGTGMAGSGIEGASAPCTSDPQVVLMMNADCGDPNTLNVFSPAILHVAPGDEVTFVSTNAGHNTASKRGMLPEGAAPWNSKLNTNATLKFDVPGVYGYVCLPHYEMGMVGLIVVGEDYSNLAAIRKVRQAGRARKAFRSLFKELEAQIS